MKNFQRISGLKSVIKISFFLLLFSSSFYCYSQGKIDKSKEDIKKGSQSENRIIKKSKSSSSFTTDGSIESVIVRVIAEAFMYVTYYTAIGNYQIEKHLHSNLTDYPYYNNSSGNYESTDAVLAPTKRLRIDLENNILYSNDYLFGNHLKAKIRPFQYFYLQTDFLALKEFDKVDDNYSNISLFNINLCYDRIRLEKFNLGWVLGMNYMGNDVKKAGFSYGLNTDIFIVNNVSLYSSMKWSLINSVAVNEFEILCKFHSKNYFFSAGYEHLKIGTPTYDFISLGGGIYF